MDNAAKRMQYLHEMCASKRKRQRFIRDAKKWAWAECTVYLCGFLVGTEYFRAQFFGRAAVVVAAAMVSVVAQNDGVASRKITMPKT